MSPQNPKTGSKFWFHVTGFKVTKSRLKLIGRIFAQLSNFSSDWIKSLKSFQKFIIQTVVDILHKSGLGFTRLYSRFSILPVTSYIFLNLKPCYSNFERIWTCKFWLVIFFCLVENCPRRYWSRMNFLIFVPNIGICPSLKFWNT